MDLQDTTPLVSRILLGQVPGADLRFGCLVVKATYRHAADNGVALDLERPLPVLEEDLQTPLGLIPRDDQIYCQRHTEVILLGTATPPRPARQLGVSLAVGDHRRELLVSGDRAWRGARGEGGASAAVPFARMPLTWARAFGGAARVALTAHDDLTVSHPLNPAGRGFDPRRMVQGLERGLFVQDGYPRWDRRRPLPNVEDPAAPVTAWSDDPVPTCWAPAPLDSPMFLARLGGAVDPGAGATPPDSEALAARAMDPEVLHRSHPAWVLPPPAPDAPVKMEGLTPWSHAAFRLPGLHLRCGHRLGERAGSAPLHMARLVLLPDEARFCLVFVFRFTYRQTPGETRALRLRMERDS